MNGRIRISEKYRPRLWLLGILVAYAALQSINFSDRWVIDESWYLMPIPSILEEGRFRIPTIPGDDLFWPQPPLLTYSEAALERLHPLSVAGARMLPLVAGFALIFATYLLGRRLYGEAVGVVAAALVASDNLVFLAARTVRPEILVALSVVTTLLLIARGTGRRNLLLAGICAGLGVSSHPNGLLAPSCAILLLIARDGIGRREILKGIEFSFWTLLAVLPLVLWIIVNDGPNDFEGFKSHWLGRYGRHADVDSSVIGSAVALLKAEATGRWVNFAHAPYRIHIALLSILAIGRALWAKEPVLRAIGAGCVVQLGFFIFVNNSSPSIRYMASLVPLVCLITAQWICELWSEPNRRAMWGRRRLLALVLIMGLGVSQVFGNGLYLWQARRADYPATIAALDALIPDKSRVYGSIIFWMGLRNHDEYAPYMRLPWERARTEFATNVVIMDDFMMADPTKRWVDLRTELYDYFDENGWLLLGSVEAGYYGQLKVYAAPRSDPTKIGNAR